MVSRIKQRPPKLSLGALDLAGWYPAAPERRGVVHTLGLDAPAVQPRNVLTVRPGFPNRPRPAFKEASNRLRDVYDDTYTLSREIERGAFGSFKVGSQSRQRSTCLMAAKEINLARIDALEDRTRMATVRSEFTAMNGGPLAPYGMVYTSDAPSVSNASMKLREAFVFMPLAEADVMEVINTLNESPNRWRASAAALAPGVLQDHALKRAGEADRINVSFARHVMRCAALELQRLHARGVVHGDLKPENLFLMRSGEVCLGDYGSSSTVDDVKEASGSWDYAAPEQFMHSYDESVDLFALGVCIITLLHSNPLQFNPVPNATIMQSHAELRRDLMELWRQQELTGVEAQVEPSKVKAWENVAIAMESAKLLAPTLMPLLLQMVHPDPSKRPSATAVLQGMDRGGLSLTDAERGPMMRALLTIPASATRKRVNQLTRSLSPQPRRRLKTA